MLPPAASTSAVVCFGLVVSMFMCVTAGLVVPQAPATGAAGAAALA